MKKVYIITWETKKNGLIGFDFNEDMVFTTRELAEAEVKENLLDERTVYEVKEVDEVFIYLWMFLEPNEVFCFTDNPVGLESVLDFCKNVSDEELVTRYLKEAISSEYFTLNRKEWINREIACLENYKAA